MDVSLVLPTYNERENLAPLLARVATALQAYQHEIIVVDDDSPDRTWEEAERLREAYPQVRVIRRRGEKGLSSAVVRGFREASGEVLGVMDADLQHDEAILPRLVRGAEQAEFMVASRAVADGGLEEWPWHRRLKSWGATALAKLVLNIPVRDPMSGYFALRRDVFAALDDGRLRPEGFKILLYLYCLARSQFGAANVRVQEVGYVFRNRLHGESKLTGRVMWDYLRMLYDLRRDALLPWSFLRFAGVGALGVLVNCLILLGLTQGLGLHYLLAGAFAVEAAILHNFLLHEFWTFGDRRRQATGRWPLRLARFQMVSLGGMAINLAVLAFLKSGIGLPLLTSNLIGILGATLWNYVANKLWTWDLSAGPVAGVAGPRRIHGVRARPGEPALNGAVAETRRLPRAG
jgi:dolichol-phosphate mannosyltransferase